MTTITAKVLADSVSPCGARLTTMQWTYPRAIHAEIMTHRMLSKNSASSRAIPYVKLRDSIIRDSFVPLVWGLNEKGMQAYLTLPLEQQEAALSLWLGARDTAIRAADVLYEDLHLHKQICNRIVEPWMHITIIVSATDWTNLFGLRCHPDAEPHFQKLAYAAQSALSNSTPKVLAQGEWHTPLIDAEDYQAALSLMAKGLTGFESDTEVEALTWALLRKVSVGRCARVSYLTHEGKRDLRADIELHDRLMVQKPLHATPSEHVAQALDWPSWFSDRVVCTDAYHLRNVVVAARRDRETAKRVPTQIELMNECALGELTSGNFLGWRQHRKSFPNENIGGLMS